MKTQDLLNNIKMDDRQIKTCPHCDSNNTRRDFDYPENVSSCKDCGCDYMHEDGHILLNPDTDC